MITPKEEEILNKLEVIGLLVRRGTKLMGTHAQMSRKYLVESVNEIKKLMAFIGPEGRTE